LSSRPSGGGAKTDCGDVRSRKFERLSGDFGYNFVGGDGFNGAFVPLTGLQFNSFRSAQEGETYAPTKTAAAVTKCLLSRPPDSKPRYPKFSHK